MDDHHSNRLLDAIHRINETLEKINANINIFPILIDISSIVHAIREQNKHIMSAISDYAAKQKEYNATTGAAIDGIVEDIKGLNDKITELQNSPGSISPSDQQLLDELQADGAALAAKIKAVDDNIPPVVPPIS